MILSEQFKSKMNLTSKWFKLSTALTLLLLLSMTAMWNQADASAKQGIKVTVNQVEQQLSSSPIMYTNRVYVPLRDLGRLIGYRTSWNSTSKSIHVSGVGQDIKLKPNSKQATVNQQSISLKAEPIVRKGTTYVPIQLFTAVLDIPLTWNQKTSTVEVTYNAPYIYTELGESSFWVSKSNGNLYMNQGQSTEIIGEANFDLHEYAELTVKKLDSRGYLLQILDSYGEPRINTVIYKAVIRDGKLVTTSQVKYSGLQSMMSIDSVGELIVMIDGQTLKLVGDDGKVKYSYTFTENGDQVERFTVEGHADHYLLIRLYDKATLMLFDTNTNELTPLYKQLLSKKERDMIDDVIAHDDTNDASYRGDRLSFVKQEGNKLIFKHIELYGSKESTLVYELK